MHMLAEDSERALNILEEVEPHSTDYSYARPGHAQADRRLDISLDYKCLPPVVEADIVQALNT